MPSVNPQARLRGEPSSARFVALAAGLLVSAAACGQSFGQINRVIAERYATAPAAPASDQENLKAITLNDGIKQLKRIRLKHFGDMRNNEIRQVGIAKLKDYTESKFYPSLLEIFANEKHDVRTAVLDLLADQKDSLADSSLAYGAVFDKDEWFRTEATKRLVKRTGEINAGPQSDPPPDAVPGLDSGVNWRIKAIINNGLKQKDDTVAAAAGNLAAELKLFELIPSLINAQIQGPTGSFAGTGTSSDSALAYIIVGTQEAFVSDLTPVVGDSAVAFDPTVSVATSGTVLRIIDAAVVTYRTEILYSLRRLASAGWNGQPVDYGWDNNKWRKWYTEEFVPYRQSLAAAETK